MGRSVLTNAVLVTVILAAILFVGEVQSKNYRYWYEFEPISLPEGPGEGIVKLRFWQSQDYCRECECCDEADLSRMHVKLRQGPHRNAELIGPDEWTFELTPDQDYETELRFVLPANDTTSLNFVVEDAGGDKKYMWVNFVTTANSTEFRRGDPRNPGIPPTPRADSVLYRAQIDLSNAYLREKLLTYFQEKDIEFLKVKEPHLYEFKSTRDQIDGMIRKGWPVALLGIVDSTRYLTWIDLSNPVRREQFMNGIKKQGLSLESTEQAHIYHLWATRNELRNLLLEGWSAGFVDSVHLTPYPLYNDSTGARRFKQEPYFPE